jgi:uncharacterized SAM-binding protein YcdF (DUF218 family)
MQLWIQKTIIAIVSPLPIAVFFLMIGIALLIFNKKRSLSLTFFILTFLILILSGYGTLNPILKEIENRFEPMTDPDSIIQILKQKPKHVVVLGSGHVSDPRLPVTSQINSDSLHRLMEGIRIYRSIPGSKLLLMGGPGFDPVPNAKIMAETAKTLGVPSKDIHTDMTPTNTEEEIKAIKKRIGQAPFVLVTSAVHMNRAVELCSQNGLQPTCAPTDYIIKNKTQSNPSDLLPSCRNISRTERVLYEIFGSIYLKLKKQFA